MKIVTLVTFRVKAPLTAGQKATFERYCDLQSIEMSHTPMSTALGYGFEYFTKHVTTASATVIAAVANSEHLIADSLGVGIDSDAFLIVQVRSFVPDAR